MPPSPSRLRHTLAASVALALTLGLGLAPGQAATPTADTTLAPAGGSGAAHGPADELTPEQSRAIEAQIAASKAALAAEGKLPAAKAVGISLAWPLQLAPGAAAEGYHGTSNFVDHNASFPNQLLDFSGGDRTYDLASGYNHAGTDLFLTPFAWQMMDAGAVQVVAAAPGVIVLKQDGNYDRNCSFNSGSWNAVYVRHADDSVAWYGHLRSGSLTSKAVGDSVAAGEYLGLVGSSGSSTAPHLHLEIHDASGDVIDPYAGPFNPTVGQTLWQQQPAYYDSAVNRLGTGGAAPVFPACPAPEQPNEASEFAPGSTIYFTAYYRDQRAGQVSTYRIYRPDGTVYRAWTHSINPAHYVWSYWYWYLTIPSGEAPGVWQFAVTFEGKTATRSFAIGDTLLPPRLYLTQTTR